MTTDDLQDISEADRKRIRGWITPAVAWSVRMLSYPNDLLFGPRTGEGSPGTDLELTARRVRLVDAWVLAVTFLLTVCYHVIPYPYPVLRYSAVAFAAWVPIQILAVATNLALFDRWRVNARERLLVASHTRIVVLGLVNYVQIWIAFGCLYSALRDSFSPQGEFPRDWFDPLYFSAITQLTIGYGDIAPRGIARAVVVAHGFASMLLLLLLLGRFVSLLRPDVSLDEAQVPSTDSDKSSASGGPASTPKG